MNPRIEAKIDELLAKMTLREKVGQLNLTQNNFPDREKLFEMLRNGEVGGIICCYGKFDADTEKEDKNRAFINELQRAAVEESRLGIPVIFGRDVIHGHNVAFPNMLAMACSFNPEMVEGCYRRTAADCANDGINWAFSPMIDIARDPRWGRCAEGPGEDPYLGAQMAAAAVRGFQGDDLSRRDSIVACAKHYIGYGAAEGGRDYHKVEMTDYTLRNFYLTAYKSAVKAGCRTVMSSFNEIGGQAVTASHYLLTDVLRGELGFDGFVVSDDWSVVQQKRQGIVDNDVDASASALNAGVDMDMDDLVYINNMEKAFEEGKVSMEVIDEAVRRILRVKFEAGLFEHPYCERVPVDFDEHLSFARKIAGESIVLLKNENNALPLKKGSPVAIAGDFEDDRKSIPGTWAADYVSDWVKSVMDGIRIVSPDSELRRSRWKSVAMQTTMCKRNDSIVIVLGDDVALEGEASSVARIELHEEQRILVENARKYGKKVIGVLLYGRPVALEAVEPCFDAILMAWHCGSETGTAVADILFGDVNPSGKLSMTLPRVTGQIPIYYNSPNNCRDIDEYYRQGKVLDNYRDEDGSPMYPFGYGLSYTEFSYEDPVAAKAGLTYEEVLGGAKFEIRTVVRNIGDVIGKETAQCYVRDPLASMMRPIRELKGFRKVELKPGEATEVTFRLGWEELGFYGKDGKFAAEKGKFIIYVGGNCLAKQSVEIEII